MITNEPSSPKNEFDYVGLIHNQVVSEFVKQTEGEKLTNEEVLDKVKTITLSNPDYAKRFGTEYLGLTIKQVNEGIKDFPNEFKNIINSLPISSEAKEIFNGLLNETFEIENSDLSYDRYREYVLILEEKIIDNKSLPKKEKEAVLCSTSVARYSSYLWFGKINEGSTSKKFFGQVIAGDVAGGILGAVFGGVVGAIGGASGGSSLVHTINESK